MPAAAAETESDTRQRQADEGPYYSVDIVDRDGLGSWPCRAHSVAEALAKAGRHHIERDCRIGRAEFDKLHLGNRIPDSATKIYHGIPLVAGQAYVYVRLSTSSICKDLKPRLDLAKHSPDGFGWGYEESGPAQLSLALLADALEDDERALKLYQPFKKAYIAGWPPEKEWELSASCIQAMASETERQMAEGLAA